MHRFKLSALGDKFYRDGQLCFGNAKVDTITAWSPIEKAPGVDLASTDVSFTYQLENVPDWARRADVQAANPIVGKLLSGAESHKTAVASLTREGNEGTVDKFR